jgi:rubredoxin
MSALRLYLDGKRREGRLDHPCPMCTWAYEGTGNLQGPSGAVPRNLIEAGDMIGFAPIMRCYAHDFADPACPDNARHHAALASWFKDNAGLPMTVCEYYNVSKYEDLPLLFTTRLAHDLPAYYAMGVQGMSYMHPPLVNWGPRALTQVLYAQLSWDIRTDTPVFLEEFFRNWYGPHAGAMRRAYDKIEEAWLAIGAWRGSPAADLRARHPAADDRAGRIPRRPVPPRRAAGRSDLENRRTRG